MAIKYLNHIDLNKNELRNAVIHPLGTAPSSPREGQIYYNSTDKKLYIWDGDGGDWMPIGDVHTIEGNSINLNGTVSASLPGASDNPPLIEVHESDDGANTGGNGTHDHGVVDLRILETDGIYEDIVTNGDKGEFLVRSKYIFNYIKNYVTISGTSNEIDVYTSDVNQSPQTNPGISENATIYIGLPKDVVIANNLNTVLGEDGTAGDASLTVQGETTLGRNGSATDDLVTIYGDTTLGTSGNNVDLIVNGEVDLGVVGASNLIQINGDTTIGDASNAKNLIVWGDLTVQGTTTTVNSETVTIADNFILLNSNVDGSTVLADNAGIEVQRDSGTVDLRWNESTEKWQVTENGSDYYNIVTGYDQVAANVGDGSSTSFTITHNWDTRDIIVQIFDTTTYETVHADVARSTVNTITVTVANIAGNIPSTNGLRVLLQRLY